MANALSRWNQNTDPFRDTFARFFNQALGQDLANLYESGEEVSNRSWLPAVDISESDDSLVLTAELPGLTADDVDITLEKNVLSIRGERKFERDTKKENFHRIERTYGAFSRSFTLPGSVRSDEVNARFENGVLRIEVPKAEEAKPRKVAIS